MKDMKWERKFMRPRVSTLNHPPISLAQDAKFAKKKVYPAG